jgi:hypothetical protein
MTHIVGRCHCGNLEMEFDTALRIDELPVRRDTCSFCTKHGARTIADPHGRVSVVVHEPADLLRYRFALETADFLVCRRCGVYLAALLATANGTFATLNVNTFDCADQFAQTAVAVSYDAESAAQRVARRERNWTPAIEAVRQSATRSA